MSRTSRQRLWRYVTLYAATVGFDLVHCGIQDLRKAQRAPRLGCATAATAQLRAGAPEFVPGARRWEELDASRVPACRGKLCTCGATLFTGCAQVLLQKQAPLREQATESELQEGVHGVADGACLGLGL